MGGNDREHQDKDLSQSSHRPTLNDRINFSRQRRNAGQRHQPPRTDHKKGKDEASSSRLGGGAERPLESRNEAGAGQCQVESGLGKTYSRRRRGS